MQILKVGDFIFECTNDYEVWRAQNLFTKEEGTIQWLGRLQPGDVLYDVGANIGLYSLVGGKAVGPGGHVYAFEAHVGNASRLLRNIRLNKLTETVQVLAIALHDREGFFPFNYTSNEPGSSGSQLGHTLTEFGQNFPPVATELKYATTLDALVKGDVIRPPQAIKIDVDGNEPLILAGMVDVLRSPGLRTVQVEMHPGTEETINEQMTAVGFVLIERHYTGQGKKQIAKGVDPTKVFSNTIFERPQ